MDLDLSEPELPVLEYARLHGLCTNYTLEQPCYGDIPIPSVDVLEKDVDFPVQGSVQEFLHERLTVKKDEALLLKEVLSTRDESCMDDGEPYSSWKRTSALKLELPLLRTDNELDLLGFGSTKIPNVADAHIPIESIEEENDEGLQWPFQYLDFPGRIFKGIEKEKIQVSKEAFVMLQKAVTDQWTKADSRRIESERVAYCKQSTAAQPLTPPLLPLSPPMTPYIPSSPANRLELLTESSTSPARELKAIESSIMKDETLVADTTADLAKYLVTQDSDEMLLDDHEPLHNPLGSTPCPVERRIQDLKVEGPLTPEMFSESPMKKIKSVSFRDMVAEYIPELPSTFESGAGILNDSDDFADFYKEIQPIADVVNRRVEKEQLSEVDTTKRLDVPEVESKLPVAPWDEYSRKKNRTYSSEETDLDAQRRFLLKLKRTELKTMSSWHGVSKLDRELNWAVFPIEWGNIQLEETLHGEEPLRKLFSELTAGDIATSITDIWRREGLRILDHDEDSDEELDIADLREPSALDAALSKRKFEVLDNEAEYKESAIVDAEQSSLKQDNRQRALCSRGAVQNESVSPPLLNLSRKSVPDCHKRYDNSLMFGGKFSATAALHKFMGLQGKETTTEINASSPASKTTTVPIHMDTAIAVRSSHGKPAEKTTESAMDTKRRAMPVILPPVPERLAPSSYIMSSTLLRQRVIFREVQKLYGSAEIVERDFSLPHSPAEEADMILSPYTGLICTTLQMIKQRALPGQANRSPIRERVVNLQARYERLIILVSEGLSREAEQSGVRRPVDSRDQEALSEFEKFISSMEAEVLQQFIQGGELALARAIVVEMAKWGLPHGSKDIGDLKLLEDETTWEVLLRRAGLNPYAAQIILATFKDPYELPLATTPSSEPNSPGPTIKLPALPAFILLSAEERIARFQVLLGGNRILKRVNALLDRTWLSAANGFRT